MKTMVSITSRNKSAPKSIDSVTGDENTAIAARTRKKRASAKSFNDPSSNVVYFKLTKLTAFPSSSCRRDAMALR